MRASASDATTKNTVQRSSKSDPKTTCAEILLTLPVAENVSPPQLYHDMKGQDVLNDISELPPLPGQQLFSRRTLAAILDVSIETVSRRIKAGDIKAVKVGSRLVRIPRSEVERLLSPNSEQTGNEL